MSFKVITVYVGLLILVGCSQSMRLYPIRGPITAESPIPTIKATVLPFALAGRVSLILPNGETCRGSWNNGAASMPSTATQPKPEMTDMNLSNVWDEIFGAGYFVAHVVGVSHHGHASLIGDSGTTVEMDFLHPFTQDSANKLVGVAIDNKGNIFKITS